MSKIINYNSFIYVFYFYPAKQHVHHFSIPQQNGLSYLIIKWIFLYYYHFSFHESFFSSHPQSSSQFPLLVACSFIHYPQYPLIMAKNKWLIPHINSLLIGINWQCSQKIIIILQSNDTNKVCKTHTKSSLPMRTTTIICKRFCRSPSFCGGGKGPTRPLLRMFK